MLVSGEQTFSSSYYPKIRMPERLNAIKRSNMTDAEFLLVSSIQGIVAQTRPEIYIEDGTTGSMWLDAMSVDYGIPACRHESADWFISHYREIFEAHGYILADVGCDSVNVATTACGLLRAPIVDRSMAAKMESMGFRMCFDATQKTEKWAFESFQRDLCNTMLFRQDPKKIELRDYAIASRCFTFGAGDGGLLDQVYAWAPQDTPLLGWGLGIEDDDVAHASEFGHMTVPSDWALNLSTLSALGPGIFRQRYHVANMKFGEKVHYVTFIMSDGDNVQWLLGGMPTDSKYYGSVKRGAFPMGFTISPSLADLAPCAMKWYYDNARQDYFIAGVSGTGYMNPSRFPAMDSFLWNLDSYMSRTDLSIVALLDQVPMDSIEFAEMIQAYAGCSNIIGGVYLTGYKYSGGAGRIEWACGKPFVSVRESLWETDPLEIAERINSYPPDPETSSGYTLVNVHPWSHSLDDVSAVMDNLNCDVAVVSPEEFFLQIVHNMG